MTEGNCQTSDELSSLRASTVSRILNESTNNNCNKNVTTASISSEEQCILDIIKILNLNLNDLGESKRIAKESIIEGRQALKGRKNYLSRDIYENQIREKQSELLDVLKAFIEQEWKEKINEEWFHEFLEDQRLESEVTYQQILTRIAEYGLEFMKSNALLSITLQFLFKFDDATMQNNKTFNKLWNTIISEGRHGFQHYKHDFAPKVLKELLKNDHNALYYALKGYFYQPLENLLIEVDLDLDEQDLLTIAVDSVVNSGWWDGLHDEEVRKLIDSKKYNVLIEKLKEYLNKQGLPIPDPSPPTSIPPDDMQQQESTTAAEERKYKILLFIYRAFVFILVVSMTRQHNHHYHRGRPSVYNHYNDQSNRHSSQTVNHTLLTNGNSLEHHDQQSNIYFQQHANHHHNRVPPPCSSNLHPIDSPSNTSRRGRDDYEDNEGFTTIFRNDDDVADVNQQHNQHNSRFPPSPQQLLSNPPPHNYPTRYQQNQKFHQLSPTNNTRNDLHNASNINDSQQVSSPRQRPQQYSISTAATCYAQTHFPFSPFTIRFSSGSVKAKQVAEELVQHFTIITTNLIFNLPIHVSPPQWRI
ncbi:unnamed protein product [Adineta steineri]|uniref:Uncharacterized protein n=1 Tax=Adineta steineri TaxID=433720 RepID=A0A815MML5_9BILA|nr:unnamed protein product [Adineta steineri]CAF3991231.1 unnamed protein product [Adineta steineri]